MKDESSAASMNGRSDESSRTPARARDEDELTLIFYLNEDADNPSSLLNELDDYCDPVEGEAEPIRRERIGRCIRALWSRRWAGWSRGGTRPGIANRSLTYEQWTELSRQALGPSYGRCPAPETTAPAESPDKVSGFAQGPRLPIQNGYDLQVPAGSGMATDSRDPRHSQASREERAPSNSGAGETVPKGARP